MEEEQKTKKERDLRDDSVDLARIIYLGIKTVCSIIKKCK